MINLSYDLYQSQKASFGIGVGAHVADLDLKISGEGSVGGVGDVDGDAEEDILAPLPNLYATGMYAFRDDLIFRYGGGWMSMSYDEYHGDLLFARTSLEYWPSKNIGIGAGYSYLSADIKHDKKIAVKKKNMISICQDRLPTWWSASEPLFAQQCMRNLSREVVMRILMTGFGPLCANFPDHIFGIMM